MKFQWKPPEGAVGKLLDQYKYVLIVVIAGIVLLLWPSGEKKQAQEADGAADLWVLWCFASQGGGKDKE